MKLSPKKEPLSNLFDRFLQQQRQDVEVFSSGYMNPQKINQRLQKEKDKTKKPAFFGKQAYSSKEEEKDLSPGEMLEVLEEFDNVKAYRREKEVSPENTVEPTEIPNRERVVKRPTRKFIAAPHFSLTKYDQYKAVTLVDQQLVQDGRSLKHNDIGKLEKLKEYRKFIDQELIAAQCPPCGPNHERLQIYSTCFEKIIQDFTSYGSLLAEIKVSIFVISRPFFRVNMI